MHNTCRIATTITLLLASLAAQPTAFAQTTSDSMQAVKAKLQTTLNQHLNKLLSNDGSVVSLKGKTADGSGALAFYLMFEVSGEQKFFGDRMVTEDDFRHGHVQYAMHKIFNEWQAQDYREKHGMEITAIRPANVTGPDKIVGSVDHVFCITNPARGKPVKFPYRDAMRCPIHVDEIAEIFARVIMTDKPQHWVYNTGGQAISLGEIADIVRTYLPDAQISFDKETGGRELSGNYLIDNTRLVSEFGMQYRPYRERVLQIINDVRKQEGLPELAPH